METPDPDKMKMDEWLGLNVALSLDHETVGGVKFAAGEVLRVEHHHRGRLSLISPDGRRISRVNRFQVTIVPPPGPAPKGPSTEVA